MLLERLGASWTDLGVVLLAGLGAYVAVIVLTRLVGVRSLAKMSSFDFAATVAVGSTFASVLLGTAPLLSGLLALALLFGLQYSSRPCVVATDATRCGPWSWRPPAT